jgi:hypothetical protein
VDHIAQVTSAAAAGHSLWGVILAEIRGGDSTVTLSTAREAVPSRAVARRAARPLGRAAGVGHRELLREPRPPITTYTQDTVLRIPAEADPEADRRLLRETGRKVTRGMLA